MIFTKVHGVHDFFLLREGVHDVEVLLPVVIPWMVVISCCFTVKKENKTATIRRSFEPGTDSQIKRKWELTNECARSISIAQSISRDRCRRHQFAHLPSWLDGPICRSGDTAPASYQRACTVSIHRRIHLQSEQNNALNIHCGVLLQRSYKIRPAWGAEFRKPFVGQSSVRLQK